MLDGSVSEHTRNETGQHLTHIHRALLRGRGFTDETIAAARLWSATANEAAEILGFNARSGGIVIPYFHPLTGAVVLNRVRPDSPPIINGKPAKYLSPRGTGNRLFFPPDCAPLLRNAAVPLFFTEAPFKALMAWQCGLFAVSGNGVWGWRGKNEQGESVPVSDFGLAAWQDRLVSIVYDSDTATNKKVRAAEEALTKELYRLGVQKVYAPRLPDLNDETTGWDDFLQAEGVDAFLDLDIQELSSPYPRIKTWSGIELLETQMERPPAVVAALGIRQSAKVMIVGAGGQGKTTVITQIGSDLAAAKPLFGYPTLEVAGPQRVAFYLAEDPLPEIRFRWMKQMKALGYGDDVAERIAFLDPHGAKLTLTDEYERAALFDALRQHRTTVAFLDPLVSLHDVEENSNSAMRAVLDLFNPFQVETGCSIFLAHHEPKNPDSNGSASRGATAIRDWSRTMLRLTSQGEKENGNRRFTLTVDKFNYGSTISSLTLERAPDSYIFVPVAEVAVTPADVWKLVGLEGRWAEDLKASLIEQFGVSEATARRAIGKAEEANLITIESRLNPETKRKKAYVLRGGLK